MTRHAGAWWLWLGLCCCNSNETDASGPGGSDAGLPPIVADRDGDGLCDDTERTLGTDPAAIDSDSDNLPDAIEFAIGLDPLSNLSPDPSEVVQLEAVPGAMVTFEPRATTRGDRGNYSGRFQSLPSIYDLTHDAGTFLDSAEALTAEPPDNIRVMDREAQRFVGVTGTTRLRFRLRFTYSLDSALSCAIAHAFAYPVLEEGEGLLQAPLYLLVLAPPGGVEGPERFCAPSGCF